MKREARLLKDKAVNSLLLAIEHFNRPSDRGRCEAVLIFLDHSFEMLLKAAILHRGGRIREPKATQTIGFAACVGKGLNDASVQFLTKEQALSLQVINGLRDAAQHHLLELPEQQLYLHTQVGVTLFRDVLQSVCGDALARFLPDRVLPVTANPPKDLALMVQDEIKLVRQLLRPKLRRRVQAKARLRALAIFEGSTRGEQTQPSDAALDALAKRLARGDDWAKLFPGLAGLAVAINDDGIPVTMRITKKEGVPIHLVPEGAPGAAVVAVRRVDELGYYSLGRDQLAKLVGLTTWQTSAVIDHLSLRDNPDYFKDFRIGKATFARYSQKAADRIKAELPSLDVKRLATQYWTRTRRVH